MSEFCKECDGWGTIEVEVPRLHNFDRDVGYLEVGKIECPECRGSGKEECEPCHYCGGNCPNDHEHMCDGYSGDIDNLYSEVENE